MIPRVIALYVYPLKGAKGIAVDDLTFDARGAIGDRRWMLVDPANVGITQRDVPRLTLLGQAFVTNDRTGALRLTMDGSGALEVAVPTHEDVWDVRVWDDMVPAHDAGDEAARWCRDALGLECRLVRLAAQARRPLQQRFAGSLSAHGRETTLSDGAPLLVLGDQSVALLNDKLATHGVEPMSMMRFRPNIFVSTVAAHDEDHWGDVRIGTVTIAIGAPCKRCVVTTVDLRTAEKGIEPLRTLATYRQDGNAVMFGMNASHALTEVTTAVLRTGDEVIVRTRR